MSSSENELNKPPDATLASQSKLPAKVVPSFGNPYDDAQVTGQLVTNVVCPVYTTDVDLIKSIRPALGTVTGVVGTLWKKLKDELIQRNITDWSKRPEFERFIAGCRIISDEQFQLYTRAIDILAKPEHQAVIRGEPVPGRGGRLPVSSASGTLPQADQRNDGGGVTQPHTGSATDAPVVPDVQSGSGAGGGRKRKVQKVPPTENQP